MLEVLIIEDDWVTLPVLIDRVYGSRRDGGPDWANKIMYQIKIKLNRKLPEPIWIEGGRGKRGYRLRRD